MLGGFRGSLFEALKAMWLPRKVPMLKNDEKVTSITFRLGPHFATFWVFFHTLELLLERFFWFFVQMRFGTDFGVVLRVNLIGF